MKTQALREQLISDPVSNVPAWTVAAFDPTIGDLPRRQMDEAGMQRYLQSLEKAGAQGVLLAASTGWGHARTFEEHEHTLMAAGKVSLENCVKQALLRMEDPLEQNISLLQKLKNLDYGIVWTRRGSLLPPDAADQTVAQSTLPLVEAATELGLPVGLYSISTVDQVPLRVEAVKILMEQLGENLSQRIVAIKITEPVFEDSTLTYLGDPAFSHKKIVQGWDAFYARALQEGLRPDGTQHCGATSGAAACMVYAYEAMYQAAQQQNWDELSTLQQVVAKVFYSMQGPDKTIFPDLQIAKWTMGLGHPLTEERSLEDAQPLLKALSELSGEVAPKYLDLIVHSLLLMDQYPDHQSPVQDRLKELLSPQEN